MTQRISLYFLAALAFLATHAIAEPLPPNTKLAISAANVDQLRPVADLKRIALTRSSGLGALAYRCEGSFIEIFDDIDFRPLRKISVGAPLVGLTASQGGRFVAWQASQSPKYVLHEIATGETIEINVGNPKWPDSRAALSPDGKWLAIENTVEVATDLEEGYCELMLWDTTMGRLARTLEGSKWGALTPVFSPDGRLLALGNRNYETRLFDVATGKLLHTLPRKMTHELTFSPDGKVLAVAYVDGTVALWDVESGELLRSQPASTTRPFSFDKFSKDLLTLDWSPKGDVLVTAGVGGKIVLWDPQELTKLTELEAPGLLRQVRFTWDGTRLLGLCEWGTKVWAIQDGADK